jgi:hypothetical protein
LFILKLRFKHKKGHNYLIFPDTVVLELYLLFLL